jgi:hypothetical protein|eukprot:COSAG06_NODE_2338_length_7054_cov_4.655787_4_plen_58_part_00
MGVEAEVEVEGGRTYWWIAPLCANVADVEPGLSESSSHIGPVVLLPEAPSSSSCMLW